MVWIHYRLGANWTPHTVNNDSGACDAVMSVHITA